MKREAIIKTLIKNMGLNIKSFSEKAGVPYTTFRSMLERGIGGASIDNVLKICSTLGITVDELESMSSGIEVEKPLLSPLQQKINKLDETDKTKIEGYADCLLSDLKYNTSNKDNKIIEPTFEIIAAHNDDTSEEQIRLMQKDLDEL